MNKHEFCDKIRSMHKTLLCHITVSFVIDLVSSLQCFLPRLCLFRRKDMRKFCFDFHRDRTGISECYSSCDHMHLFRRKCGK